MYLGLWIQRIQSMVFCNYGFGGWDETKCHVGRNMWWNKVGKKQNERKRPGTRYLLQRCARWHKSFHWAQILAAPSTVNVSVLQLFGEVSNSWSSSLPVAPPPKDNNSNMWAVEGKMPNPGHHRSCVSLSSHWFFGDPEFASWCQELFINSFKISRHVYVVNREQL